MEKGFTWEKIALPNEEKERNSTEISAMRLDYFLTSEAIGKSIKTHCKIMENTTIRTDHNPVWMVIKNPWNNIKEKEEIREKIIKINTKNRDNKSKGKITKIYTEIHNKDINKTIKDIKITFCQKKLERVIENINTELYDAKKYMEKKEVKKKKILKKKTKN
jgi:hypothetical protein